MQHISNNDNRPLALYLGQFVFASDQRKLGTKHDSTRPGKQWQKNSDQRENSHAWCEKVLKIDS